MVVGVNTRCTETHALTERTARTSATELHCHRAAPRAPPNCRESSRPGATGGMSDLDPSAVKSRMGRRPDGGAAPAAAAGVQAGRDGGGSHRIQHRERLLWRGDRHGWGGGSGAGRRGWTGGAGSGGGASRVSGVAWIRRGGVVGRGSDGAGLEGEKVGGGGAVARRGSSGRARCRKVGARRGKGGRR